MWYPQGTSSVDIRRINLTIVMEIEILAHQCLEIDLLKVSFMDSLH